MYESPIDLYLGDISHQIMKQQDEQIYQAVVHFFPDVKREELLKALQYDRGQYEAGYADGKRDAQPRWIPVTERLPARFKRVLVFDKDEDSVGEAEYDGECFKWVEDENLAFVTNWMPLPEPPEVEV